MYIKYHNLDEGRLKMKVSIINFPEGEISGFECLVKCTIVSLNSGEVCFFEKKPMSEALVVIILRGAGRIETLVGTKKDTFARTGKYLMSNGASRSFKGVEDAVGLVAGGEPFGALILRIKKV